MSEQYQVDLAYRLAGPFGFTPDTHDKTWYVDAPATVDWPELMHRIFYDANVGLRRAAPDDETWLALDSYEVSPVTAGAMLAWDGEATAEKAAAHLPWILAAGATSWEFSACYIVDETGRYDGMTGNDFSELILYRALADGRVTEAQAREFTAKLYPGNPSVFDDRPQRLTNLLAVRPAEAFRRAPGSVPFIAGPVQPEDLT
jgi:hypothetical protein